MTVSTEERVLALSGIVQAAQLVSTAAKSGMVSQSSLESSLHSIFVTNPDAVTDVYNGIEGVSLGLKLLRELLIDLKLLEHADVTRYSFALMTLARQLETRPDAMEELGLRISHIDEHRHLSDPPLLNDAVMSELAALYQSSVGQLSPRIRIIGRRHHLENTVNVNRIRALLLAGVRSAVLWHQLGGRKTQFLFSRGTMREALSYVLSIHKHEG